MLNKEEVIYNSRSLVAAWLNGKEDVAELYIEAYNDDRKDVIPCDKDTCGETIAEILMENKHDYKTIKLVGCLEGNKKILGELDIL